MDKLSISAHERNDQKRREDVFERLPQYTPLVDLWANYLEFWDRTGGFDNAPQEEIDQARELIRDKAEDIIRETSPSDLGIVDAHVNLALHTAIGIRKEAVMANPEDINE
ncbi:hypothetical protein A3F37_01125 [Candidatus Saccharibacteria bacterium RIFCSPHIGHO2_12_FULL_41_12]|nr:MAG: hypothetical protein A3F37_01125 [Candidatus Saccharibacteria bacterium RIFCSPHIGHO2_12_FULL_41_12]